MLKQIFQLFKYSLLYILTMFYAGGINGQDAIFSQFYANQLYLNPAFAGTQCNKLSMSYRNHPWPSFGTYSTYSASFDTYLPSLSGGLGVIAFADRQANMLATYSISGIYSYHFNISNNYSASLGIMAGYYRKELNWQNLVFPDQYDPFSNTYLPTSESQPPQSMKHNVDFAAGVLVFSDDFYGGISAYHLSQPDMGFYIPQRLPLKMTAHLGYNLYPETSPGTWQDRPTLTVSPNIIYQMQNQYHRINAGAYFDYGIMTVGGYLRYDFINNFYIIFLLGVNTDMYRVGYSFDHSLSGLYGVSSGVHEISVSLKFNCERKKSKYRILNCPTF